MDEKNDVTAPASEDVKALANIAKSVSEISPVKAFLGPSAKALGDHLGDRVRKWVDDKKSANARSHARAVLEDAALDDIPDNKQLDLLRWYEKAGEVDPDEIEKSAAVKAALKATLAGKGNDAEILMSLTKDEILSIRNKKALRSLSYATALLKEKHLVENVTALSLIINGLLMRLIHVSPIYIKTVIFAILIITFLPVISEVIFDSRSIRNTISYLFDGKFTKSTISYGVSIVIVVTGIALYLIRLAHLTDKGKYIGNLIAEYLNETPRPKA